MGRKRFLLIAVAIVGGALVAPAKSNTTRFTDANDTPGKLDVKAVRHSRAGGRAISNARRCERNGRAALSGDET